MIQLLVSVRNSAEARIAAEHGADIVDVKEPRHGPLGFAGADVVDEVVRELTGRVQVSAALGEWQEWDGAGPCPVVSGQLKFVKLGMAGAAGALPLDDSWQQAIERVRLRISVAANWTEACQPRWISVAYADHQSAAAPPPDLLLEHAARSGNAGLLLDTFDKRGPGVLDLLGDTALQQLREDCRDAGLLFALAGRLRLEDAEKIVRLAPDIAGVRGAVCVKGDRSGSLNGTLVRQLKQQLLP